MASATPPAQDRNTVLADLLARTALADQRAFAELYQRTSSHLFGVAIRIVRESATAEEILQEAYVSVWHHAGSYAAAKSQPLTWLTAVVRNRCLDHVRKRELDTVALTRSDDDGDEIEISLPSGDPSPTEMLMAGADAQSVRDCVDTLDGGPKQAIALAFFQGLTHAELAQHMREPLGTVKSWVRRGLEKLKNCLDRAGVAR